MTKRTSMAPKVPAHIEKHSPVKGTLAAALAQQQPGTTKIVKAR